MCKIDGCNQSTYYEGEGMCYFHWKQHIGLIPKEDRVHYLKKSDLDCLAHGYKSYIPIDFEPFVRKHATRLAKACDFDRIDDLGQVGRAELVSVAGSIDESKHIGAIINYITRTVLGAMLSYIANADGAVSINNQNIYYDKDRQISYEHIDMGFVLADEQGTPEAHVINKERDRIYHRMHKFRDNRMVFPDTLLWDKCIMADKPWSSRKVAERIGVDQSTIVRQVTKLKEKFKLYYEEKEK